MKKNTIESILEEILLLEEPPPFPEPVNNYIEALAGDDLVEILKQIAEAAKKQAKVFPLIQKLLAEYDLAEIEMETTNAISKSEEQKRARVSERRMILTAIRKVAPSGVSRGGLFL